MSDRLARGVFLSSLATILLLGAVAYGIAMGHYELWPFRFLAATKNSYLSLIRTGSWVPERLVVRPPYASAKRITLYRPGQMAPGFYAFLGWDESSHHYAAWLYDDAGTKRHTWTIDYDRLDPDGPLNGSDMPHGMALLRDGSLIVNFDMGDVMARIDSCSHPVWVRHGVFHHSIQRAENGTYWTWRGDNTAYSQYQYLVNFDAGTGTTIREISLVDDIIRKMGAKSTVFGVRPDHRFRKFDKDPTDELDDIFHPNDIDVLYSNMADKFPEFQAGDLLISLRNLNLVAVLDPVRNKLKWWSHGPWRFQHDPDFSPDGRISVYDNNRDFGRSEIIKMNPRTREIANEQFGGELRFYSSAMGKHQYLPNGNLLVVSPEEGRVIIVSKSGKKVFEFNNVVNDRINGNVENGIMVDKSYFTGFPKCNIQSS